MLVECGFSRAQAPDGTEFTFRPSLGRIAALGSPQEIVAIFVGLHGPKAASLATYILASLCDQDDPFPLIGWHEGFDDPRLRPGSMPDSEKVILARHLMQHGIIGKAKPGEKKDAGKYADRFDAAEYIAAARVHLGLSSADAEALSMTEFQTMLEMRFPTERKRDVPTREEYDAQMAALKERRRG